MKESLADSVKAMFTTFHSWGQGNKGHGYGDLSVTLYPVPVGPGPGPGATVVEEGVTLGVNAQNVGRSGPLESPGHRVAFFFQKK